jgi:hypothetical protein
MREQVKQLGHLLMLIFHEYMHPGIYALSCIYYRIARYMSSRDGAWAMNAGCRGPDRGLSGADRQTGDARDSCTPLPQSARGDVEMGEVILHRDGYASCPLIRNASARPT